jgi:dTDP-4-amino-4,6-dideoxygalactose transaminase
MNPSFPVTRSFLPPINEYMKELESVWDSHWLTNQGPLHQMLEANLKKYLGVNNITLFTNGHLALEVAIKGLSLSGEIITTPFSFASTTHAVVLNGLTPVFCDIKKDDFTIDEESIEEKITKKTSAILAVHVYGNPCNMRVIDKIAKKYNVHVIYDAAHAFGELVDGKPITDFGDVSMYSFHATKVFHTIEGGALIYSNENLSRSFDLYKNFGITGPENVEAVGLNAKMSEFQAAMGLVNLRYIDAEIAARKQLFDVYLEELGEISGLVLPKRRPEVKYNNSYFPIIVDPKIFGLDRNELHDMLINDGIYPRKYFSPLITDFECYREKYKKNHLPIAKWAADGVLTLPLHGGMSEADVKYICGKILLKKMNG